MAKYINIGAINIGGIGLVWPGTILDNQYDNIARYQSAGAALWPYTDAVVLAAANTVNANRPTGIDINAAQVAMQNAVMTSLQGSLPVHLSVTIGFADWAGLAAGVKTADVSLGGVLPANAKLMGPPSLTGWTGFDDATHGTYAAIVGTSAGGNQIATTQSVAAGQSGFPKVMAAGAAGFPGAAQGGAQVSVRITSSVDLNTATAGAVTVNLTYYVLA